jgi:hypothetical protein
MEIVFEQRDYFVMSEPLHKIRSRQDWTPYVAALYADVGSKFIIDDKAEVWEIYKAVMGIISKYGMNNRRFAKKHLIKINQLVDRLEKAIVYKKLQVGMQ